MDNWPVSLQQRLNASGFQKSFGRTTVRSDVDVGPSKVRSRFTDAIDIYRCTIYLDFDEHDTFETFYKTTLNNGVNQFTFTDPFTEAEATFRFAEEPDIRPIGGRVFQVNMIWEKIP